MKNIIIREYCPADCEETARMFFDTVHTVNATDYSPEQLDAWAPADRDLDAWNRSFLRHRSLVAVLDGTIVGFGDMDTSGYLDRLYVHRDFQRRGIAAMLCDRLEESVPAETVTTHASITARPLFEKRGYAVVREQQVERFGVRMTNFVMEKRRTFP